MLLQIPILQVSTMTSAHVYQSLGVDNSWNEEEWKRQFKVCIPNRPSLSCSQRRRPVPLNDVITRNLWDSCRSTIKMSKICVYSVHSSQRSSLIWLCKAFHIGCCELDRGQWYGVWHCPHWSRNCQCPATDSHCRGANNGNRARLLREQYLNHRSAHSHSLLWCYYSSTSLFSSLERKHN